MEAEQLREISLIGVSRKRVILLLLYGQSRKIEGIWSRRSMSRARHCPRRLATSHEVASDADLMAASAIRINKQSPDIECGVNVGNNDLDVGAGDQDITFGYSSGETEDVIPLTHSMSTRLEGN